MRGEMDCSEMNEREKLEFKDITKIAVPY